MRKYRTMVAGLIAGAAMIASASPAFAQVQGDAEAGASVEVPVPEVALPALPVLPALPGLPALPALPEVLAAAGTSANGDVSAVAGVSGLPELPVPLPALPALPQLPTVPGVDLVLDLSNGVTVGVTVSPTGVLQLVPLP